MNLFVHSMVNSARRNFIYVAMLNGGAPATDDGSRLRSYVNIFVFCSPMLPRLPLRPTKLSHGSPGSKSFAMPAAALGMPIPGTPGYGIEHLFLTTPGCE